MERSLVVFPEAGLANRLRVIASAHLLARVLDRRFFLNWRVSDDCNASWHDLFINEFPAHPCSLERFIASNSLFRPSMFENHFFDMPEAIRQDTRSTLGIQSFLQFTLESRNELLRHKSEFYRSLNPVPEIAEKVQSFVSDYDVANMIGIHIRRGDLVTNKGWNPYAVSPTRHFIAKCRRLIEETNVNGFFLATDSEYDEHMLKKAFGTRVVSRSHRNMSRNSKEGIQDALADWLILSRTSFMVRSYFSSFSTEACVVNMIESDVILRERSAILIHISDFVYAPKRKSMALYRALVSRRSRNSPEL